MRPELDFENALLTVVREQVGGLVVGADPLFYKPDKLIALAAHYGVPTIYRVPEAAAAGGLISYGTDFPDSYRQVGVYAGRVLKGEKPADLPVQLVTKMKLIINMKTAKGLGLTFPLPLLARADEVIEWNGASSLQGSGRRPGRSWRGRSRATAYGASACSCRATKTNPSGRLSSLISFKRFRVWDGLMAVTCGWTSGGAAPMPIVDRILRGEKPGDLPVQLPTKFELVINLKTAKVLGLTIPPNLLAIADEVIE
jgi:ABC-type uncharacterized transport system substrate-binding protein